MTMDTTNRTMKGKNELKRPVIFQRIDTTEWHILNLYAYTNTKHLKRADCLLGLTNRYIEVPKAAHKALYPNTISFTSLSFSLSLSQSVLNYWLWVPAADIIYLFRNKLFVVPSRGDRPISNPIKKIELNILCFWFLSERAYVAPTHLK